MATESRPMTGVKGAGFSSAARPGTGNTGAKDSLSFALSAESMFNEPQTPEEVAADIERKINDLIEESAICLPAEKVKALTKAKDAARLEGDLGKHRKQFHLQEVQSSNLKLLVYFNLACVFEENEQYNEAQRMYQAILKEFEGTPHATRIRVNMGNLNFKQKNYQAAIKMYQMALDSANDGNRVYKHKIRRNIAYAYLIQHQYTFALQEYEGLMNEHPDMSTAFNLVLCYRAYGDAELMKESFQKLLEVAAEQKKLIRNSGGGGSATATLMDDILAPAGGTAGTAGTEGGLPLTDAQGNPLRDELGKEIQRREEKLSRYILFAAKVIIPVIESDIFVAYDYVAGLLRKENHTALAAQIEMSKATECLQRGETEKALEMLKGFTRSNDALSSSAFQNLSFVLFLEGDYAQAEHYAQMALNQSPFDTHALVNMGNCKFAVGRFEEALQFYKNALKTDPSFTDAEYNSGLALKELRKYDDALTHFERLDRRLPHNTQIMLQLSKLNALLASQPQAKGAVEGRGTMKQSQKWLQTVNTLLPTDANVLAKMGMMYAGTDDVKALYYYQEAYRVNPCSLDICVWLGTHFVKNYHFENAAPFFAQAVKIDPNPRYYILLGSCYKKMQELDKAIAVYQEAHEKYPGNVDVLKYLIATCKEGGRMELTQEYDMKLASIRSEQPGLTNLSQAPSLPQQKPPEPQPQQQLQASSASLAASTKGPKKTKKKTKKQDDDVVMNDISQDFLP